MNRIFRVALLFAVIFAAVEARQKKVVVEEPISFWEGVWNLLYAGLVSDGFTDVVLSFILLIAGYKSFKAIESEDKKDDTTWLIFWFMYALVQFAKMILDFGFKIIIPYYNENCICLLIYLAFFGGGQFVYGVIAPFLKAYEKDIDGAAAAAKKESIARMNSLKSQFEKQK